MKDILPSMPKGEIVGNMAIAKMRRRSRLSLMAIGWLWSTHKRCWNIEARTKMLEHKCWNTEAESQMQKHNDETEMELMLKHSAVIAETQCCYTC